MKRRSVVLGIESSCDETCAAVAAGPQKIRAHVVASSLSHHAAYGGVIPEIASRAHLESIVPVVDEALCRARTAPRRLNAIAVTENPGLIGSLLVGTSFARALSRAWGLPLFVVDHIRAQIPLCGPRRLRRSHVAHQGLGAGPPEGLGRDARRRRR